MQFVYRRVGEFPIELYGEIHCGVKKFNTMDYKAEIIVHENSLDDAGFVYDAILIDQHFQEVKRTCLSCELIAANAARFFAKECGGEQHVISVTVSVGGLTGAHAEYTWLPGSSMEQFDGAPTQHR